jgi:hypothetical protein
MQVANWRLWTIYCGETTRSLAKRVPLSRCTVGLIIDGIFRAARSWGNSWGNPDLGAADVLAEAFGLPVKTLREVDPRTVPELAEATAVRMAWARMELMPAETYSLRPKIGLKEAVGTAAELGA